jgi:hypothetical protein
LIAGLVLGIVNAFVRPILIILTLPLVRSDSSARERPSLSADGHGKIDRVLAVR